MAREATRRSDLHADLDDRGSLAAQWFGVLAAPIAWAIQLVLGDAFAEVGCEAGGFSVIALVLVAISVVAAAVAAAGFVVAWRGLRATSDTSASGTHLERARFMAVVGMIGSALFFALILLGGILPHLFLSTCDGP